MVTFWRTPKTAETFTSASGGRTPSPRSNFVVPSKRPLTTPGKCETEPYFLRTLFKVRLLHYRCKDHKSVPTCAGTEAPTTPKPVTVTVTDSGSTVLPNSTASVNGSSSTERVRSLSVREAESGARATTAPSLPQQNTTEALNRSRCKKGWRLFDGRCYFFSKNTVRSQGQASKICR